MHIVIEGRDATGKDTQARLLKKYLQSQGKKVIHYAESGTAAEDKFVAEVARLSHGSKQEIDHRTRVLLFLINRYEQWRKLAVPALKAGEVVITTRSWWSTLIYEGYAGGVSKNLIIKMHKLVMPEKYFHPEKIVIMTLTDKARKQRLVMQGKRFEETEALKSQPEEFQRKVNAGYLKVAKEQGIATLDAAGTIEEVQMALRELFGL